MSDRVVPPPRIVVRRGGASVLGPLDVARRNGVALKTLAGVETRPMRITLIDRHRVFADSLRLILEQEGYVVSAIEVGERETLAAVLAAGLRSTARLVLLEHRLGSAGSGTRLIGPFTAAGAASVVLTDSMDQVMWGEAVRQGASQVLHKSCSLQHLLDTVGRVRDGLPLMTPARRAALVNAALENQQDVRTLRGRLEALTRSEREILGGLMRGENVNTIARVRVVEEATVRSQVRSVLTKLEATSQLSAVASAHRAGWQPPSP